MSRLDKHEDPFGTGILCPLHERGEIGVGQRNANRADDLTTGGRVSALKRGLGIEPGSVVGNQGDAGCILADQFDLLAGDHVAVLLHVELDAVVHLRGRIGELAGIGDEQTDLDGVLSACGNDSAGQAQ